MTRKKSANKPLEDTAADIRLAMHDTDSIKEKVYLFDKMQKDEASCREIVYLSFLRGMITKEQYLDYLQIEKDCEEYDDDEDC